MKRSSCPEIADGLIVYQGQGGDSVAGSSGFFLGGDMALAATEIAAQYFYIDLNCLVGLVSNDG